MNPTVASRGKQRALDVVLADEDSTKDGHIWHLPSLQTTFCLHWKCESLPYKCHLGSPSGPHLASFTPICGSPRNATLEVLPPGFKCMDDIVLSVLTIEWWRVARQSSAYAE
ncbi:hypothetical protein BDV98DRAFT_598481 [Pterulicium gracile]|uniref:Uncharacterized protein n=1 Tax=Pterulicium gracile TaxID=1884261 RepID=A0A5C3Q311_9AGAR|nr:hypothetical protein BDV98DRAFT_598481 [Pterula gracilis]